jgi:hypothetical protein
MTVHLEWMAPAICSFVRCLGALPNLQTLDISSWEGDYITTALEDALGCVELPQIMTLILPPPTYPLLKHCRNVEDVICVIRDKAVSSDEFLGSLASNQDSKVKRLAIPLFSLDNPSREQPSTLDDRRVNVVTDCLQS